MRLEDPLHEELQDLMGNVALLGFVPLGRVFRVLKETDFDRARRMDDGDFCCLCALASFGAQVVQKQMDDLGFVQFERDARRFARNLMMRSAERQ